MEYRISYKMRYAEDGSVARQMVSCRMLALELVGYNKRVEDIRAGILAKSVKSNADMNSLCYLRPLGQGDNFVTLTTRDDFCRVFGIDKDSRLRDENTVIRISVIDE